MPDYQEEEREDTPDPEEYLPWDLDNSLPLEVPDDLCTALLLVLICALLGLTIQGVIG